jgi:hypothetical protein
MESVRKRLTYANVMSSIAVFLVVAGGSALAATQLGKNTVGAKQLKANAVTAAKIKNGAVTGAKLNLKTLGTVPSATTASSANSANTAKTADSANTAKTAESANTAKTAESASTATNATNATNAGNANTVNGLALHKIAFRFQSDSGTSSQQVLNAGGLVLTATCTNGAASFVASTSKTDSSIYAKVFDSGTNAEFFQFNEESGQFDPGDEVDLLAGQGGNNDLTLFEFDANDGSVVTGTINTDEDGDLNGCRITGTAVSG